MSSRPALCLLALLLTGCASQVMPDGSSPAYPAFSTSTPAAYPLDPTLAPDPISTTQLCAYQWANQSLIELNAQAIDAVKAAGLTGVTVLAEAFGENCIGADGQVVGFGAIQTDFWVTVEVPDLADFPAHADTVAAVLGALAPFSPDATPGPNPGYVSFKFVEGSEEMTLQVPWQDGQDVLALGLTGQALWDEILSRQSP